MTTRLLRVTEVFRFSSLVERTKVGEQIGTKVVYLKAVGSVLLFALSMEYPVVLFKEFRVCVTQS